MKRDTAYVFLDTNILLHFTTFDEIDWPNVLGYKKVILIFSMVVLSELDAKKYDKDSQRNRDRAGMINKKLEQYGFSSDLNNPSVIPTRKNTYVFYPAESINVNEYPGFNQANQDDVLIASILKFQKGNSSIESDDILFISDDLSAKVRAKASKVNCLSLSDNFRLPQEATAEQQRIRALDREIKGYKEKEPKLSILLWINEDYKKDENLRLAIPVFPKEVFDKEMKAELRILRLQSLQSEKSTNIGGFKRPAPIQRIIDKAKREKLVRDLQERIEAKMAWIKECKLTTRFTFSINNEGYVPADHVILEVEFPNFVVPNYRTPIPPKSVNNNEIYECIAIRDPDKEPAISRIFAKEDRKTVEFNCPKVVHNMAITFPPLYLTFPESLPGNSISILYRIHADNLPKPVSGEMNINVTYSDEVMSKID